MVNQYVILLGAFPSLSVLYGACELCKRQDISSRYSLENNQRYRICKPTRKPILKSANISVVNLQGQG